MKRLFTPGIALAIFLTTLATVPQQQAHGQSAGLVSSVLARLQKNHETLKSLRASISMEKYDARVREKDNYYGAVLYMPGAGKNAFVRLEWSKPQHEILGVANGQYTLYRPRLNTVYKGLAGRGKGQDSDILSMLSMSSTELQNRFQPFQEAREESLGGGVTATHLKLVPIRPMSFSYAEVWVDSAGMPVQIKIVEKNGDATTVRLTNLEKNRKLSAEEFVVKFDPSAKIVKG
jgi:outer membrane lipoprotein-sorting protein